MSHFKLLKECVLFHDFSDAELGLVEPLVMEDAVMNGKFVFHEKEAATSLFIICTGRVEILKESGTTSLVVAELGPGAHFGEMAFVDRSPRTAAASAKGELHLLKLQFADLDRVVATHPALGLKLYRAIARTLCSRVRQTTGELSSVFLS